ncbi:MAG: alanyl-tRNA editing protein [Atribacterota bacterium]
MTEKIFYLAPEQMSLETLVSKVKKREGRVALSFPQTIFFPEGGGQPADRGMIRGERWWMEVEDVSEEGGEIWHWGKMQGREPEEGEKVFMRVDEEWRRMMCEQHTAQHLFSAILERDYALSTTGFSILPDRIKIEIPCRDDLSPTVLQEAETKVRAFIRKRLPVSIYWENSSMRIVEIPGLDRNPCGGLHVSDTGYIGSFAILRFYRKNRDFWRIEFLAGGKLERAFRQMMETVDTLHTMLGNNLVEGTLTLLEKKDA